MANTAFSALLTATGTTNQINVTSGLYPVYSISDNPVLPGTGGVTLPAGTTGQRSGGAGTIRYNSTTGLAELTNDGATWSALSTAASGVDTVTGTTNRITSTGGNNPVIDISAAYVGQTSITTLGTVTTGTWSATTISETHGGTNQSTYTLGDTLYSSAANTLSKLSGNITAVKQYLSQTGTGAVSAAPAWATISGTDITGAALTKTDDTNVTLTLGGTPTTALLRAASLTLGWTGQLSLTRGGTNASLTASNGGIVWSNATQMQILSGTATANQMLQSGSTATPAWSTATWPATTTANQILYSSATNTVSEITTAASSVLITSAGSVPSLSQTLPSAVQGNITTVGALTSGSLAAGFTPVTVPLGGTGNTTFTAYSVICAGTTATGTFQNVSGVGTSGQVLTSNGAAALPTWQTNAATAGRLKSFQILTSGTAATYTTPAGITSILVECLGGGAGGGGAAATTAQSAAGGGGGGGGYCRKYFSSAAATYTYTVGATANGGTAGNNPGTAGNNTTFSTMTATGGGAGGGGVATATLGGFGSGGLGGSPTGGDFNIMGGAGGVGLYLGTSACISGGGGGSGFGGATNATSSSGASTAGNSAAATTGAGGSGGASSGTSAAAAGGNGGSGLIIVWEFS